MRTLRSGLVLLLVCAVAMPLAAAEKKKKRKNAKKGQRNPAAAVLSLPKKIELTGEQKEQVAEIRKKYAAKAKEAFAKQQGILSAEQRKAQREALKAAKQDGKKGKELREAVTAAANITAEQEAQLKEARKALAAVKKEFLTEVMGVLTDDQKKSLRGSGKAKGKRKKKDQA